MQLAGSSSWRLESGDSQVIEFALFVRDATGLPVASEVPYLAGAVPDLSGALTPDELNAAGDQWPGWWQQTLDFEFRDRPADRGDTRAWLPGLIAEREAVCDPPAFGALADRPALRRAARVCFERFRERESSRRPGRQAAAPTSLEWSLTKQVAEDVAFDRHVFPDAVQAKVVIVPVEGMWWRRISPGAVLCSPASAADPQEAHALLRDAFDSFVTRER